MKFFRTLILLLVAMLTASYVFPTFSVYANTLSETSENDSGALSGENNALSNGDSIQKPYSVSENHCDVLSDKDSAEEPCSASKDNSDTSSGEDFVQITSSVSENSSDMLPDEASLQEPDSASKNKDSALSGIEPLQELTFMFAEESGILNPDEKPMFSATIKKQFDGYVVWGYLTEVLTDTVLIQPQYSLDGENWQDCDAALAWAPLEDDDPLYNSPQDRIWLYETHEPLKSYVAGKLERFYLRLHIARKNGVTYETQTALIEKGEPEPVPEGMTATAYFSLSMLFREPGSRIYCGGYQLNVSTDTTSEDITSLLPDTLPIQVDLKNGGTPFESLIIDCPVTWKPISLSGLAGSESVVLQDAAEEIVIPAGTLLHTPMGIFTLNGPLGIDSNPMMTNKISLILNVIPEGATPTGVLTETSSGLAMAFDTKPTGATTIRAYTLTEGDTEWHELLDLPLLEAVNAQPSSASSGYTYMLDKDEEPYRSYLAAIASKEEPTPFYVGLKIEGGIYNGCQLILAWPDTYAPPPNLIVGGAGGNEGNAGSNNKGDSTEEGQRPNLPQDSTDTSKEGAADSTQNTTDAPKDPPSDQAQNAGGSMENAFTPSTQTLAYEPVKQQPDAMGGSADAVENPQTDFTNNLINTLKSQLASSLPDIKAGLEKQPSQKPLSAQNQPTEPENDMQLNQDIPLICSQSDASSQLSAVIADTPDNTEGKISFGVFLPVVSVLIACPCIVLTAVKWKGKRISAKDSL